MAFYTPFKNATYQNPSSSIYLALFLLKGYVYERTRANKSELN